MPTVLSCECHRVSIPHSVNVSALSDISQLYPLHRSHPISTLGGDFHCLIQ